jgi:threonine 3-dehydrogenase
MRALTKLTPGPGLALVDSPEPVCGPGQVKLRVLRAGLCGTDLHLHDWDDWAAATVRTPLVLGHEFYGEVVEVGDGVVGIAAGDRASGEGHIVCGRCRNCRAGRRHVCIHTVGLGVNTDGAFADFVVLPAANVWLQPPSIDPDLGAIFDPLGNATHTALQWPLVGEDVLITGAGPIGVMAAAIARHAGARHIVVTDLSDFRLSLAAAVGADRVVNARTGRLVDAQRDLGMQEGFDIGLEMSGSPAAVAEMLGNLNHGHLRTRDVRDLVPDELDARHVRRPRRPDPLGHHPPVPRRAVAGRVRGRPLGRLREGHPRLGALKPCRVPPVAQAVATAASAPMWRQLGGGVAGRPRPVRASCSHSGVWAWVATVWGNA